MRIRLQTDARRSGRPYWDWSASQVEFPSAIEADLVCAVFDSEYTALVAVPAAKDKLKYVEQKFHKSCACWRRSQLPLASNHSSRERTLARARAMAQSAAP